MNGRCFLLLLLSTATTLALLEPASVSVKESDRFRESLAKVAEIVVFEGLPHQFWQHKTLEEELKRQDIIKIWDFHFYTPAVKASNADELTRLLGASASIQVYGGPKNCGGYHPDYCVAWTVERVTYHALVCFGCHEVVFFDGKKSFKYDLAQGMQERFKEVLSIYAKKRPNR